ncbi:hypothetical protein SAY86_024387 [Trapa natans]|uniref:Uncharacterized protein n=1 Tax=Trapa natans TaxID=22666 RepID=A0AAN7RDE2_TRANT|nr:hypothetical protein SAY86_024387 [Trapa natans]
MKMDQGGMLSPHPKPVVIREVWSHNLDYEFCIIRQIIRLYPLVSMDTEFPGVVFVPAGDLTAGHRPQSPHEQYWFLKKNVDALKLIQLIHLGVQLPGLRRLA